MRSGSSAPRRPVARTAPRPSLRPDAERNQLFAAHAGLVGYTLTRYFRRHLRSNLGEDLHAAGCLGLLRACELWDASRGLDVATLAVPWIRSAMTAELRRSGAIRRPERVEVERMPTRVQFPLDLEGFSAIVDPRAPDPAELAERAEEAALLTAAIAELPDDEREVIERRLAGLTHDQAAEALGTKEPRARLLADRAKRRLRERLAPDDAT